MKKRAKHNCLSGSLQVSRLSPSDILDQITSLLWGGGCPACTVEHSAASLAPTQQMPVELPNQLWQPKMCPDSALQAPFSGILGQTDSTPCWGGGGGETEKKWTLIKIYSSPNPRYLAPFIPVPTLSEIRSYLKPWISVFKTGCHNSFSNYDINL